MGLPPKNKANPMNEVHQAKRSLNYKVLLPANHCFLLCTAFKPVGFYKRGCQEKTLFLFREEGIFF